MKVNLIPLSIHSQHCSAIWIMQEASPFTESECVLLGEQIFYSAFAVCSWLAVNYLCNATYDGKSRCLEALRQEKLQSEMQNQSHWCRNGLQANGIEPFACRKGAINARLMFVLALPRPREMCWIIKREITRRANFQWPHCHTSEEMLVTTPIAKEMFSNKSEMKEREKTSRNDRSNEIESEPGLQALERTTNKLTYIQLKPWGNRSGSAFLSNVFIAHRIVAVGRSLNEPNNQARLRQFETFRQRLCYELSRSICRKIEKLRVEKQVFSHQ